jgi:hypothetical protein
LQGGQWQGLWNQAGTVLVNHPCSAPLPTGLVGPPECVYRAWTPPKAQAFGRVGLQRSHWMRHCFSEGGDTCENPPAQLRNHQEGLWGSSPGPLLGSESCPWPDLQPRAVGLGEEEHWRTWALREAVSLLLHPKKCRGCLICG